MLLSFLVYHLVLACYRFTRIVLDSVLKMTSMVKLPAKEKLSEMSQRRSRSGPPVMGGHDREQT